MSSSPSPEAPWWHLLLPALVALAAYWGVWSGGFCFDDPIAVVSNPLVNGQAGWLDAFTSNFWGDRPGFDHLQSWRPLTVLDLRLDHVLGGGAPWMFHLGNLLLLMCVASLSTVTAQRIGLGPWISVVLGVIVAAHPIFSEATASVVGKGDLLASLVGLAGLLLSGRSFALGLAVCVGALLAKESAVVFMAALCVLALADDERRRALVVVVLVGVWYGVRAAVLSGSPGELSPIDNPLVEAEGLPRIVAAFAIVGRYLSWWIAPQAIAPDYAAGVNLTDQGHVALWLGLGGGAVLVALLVMSWLRRDRPLLAALTVVVSSLALLSNALMVLPTPLAGRLAFPVGLGLTFAAAIGAARLQGRWRPTLLGIAISWLLVGVPATRTMVDAWASDAALFAHSVEVLPDSARGRTNHAKQLLDGGENKEAEEHLRAVLARTPDYPLALQNLTVALSRQGRREEAWPIAIRAANAELRPGQARANLCDIAAVRSTLEADEAAKICRAATDALPDAAEPRANLARALARGMRFEEAEAVWKYAVEHHPRSVFVLGHRVSYLLSRGRMASAIPIQRKLVAAAPTDPQHRRNLVAILLQRSAQLAKGGDRDAACEVAREAGEIAPGAPPVEARMRALCEAPSP